MNPLKTALHTVTGYLPQIFMVLVLIAAFSMARLPVQETPTAKPTKTQMQSAKTAQL